jgi:ABC-type Fe3+-siderophore transport system permease subunit
VGPIASTSASTVRSFAVAMTACTLALAALCTISLCTGSLALSPSDVWHGLQGRASAEIVAVVRDARLPRLALALIVGGALASAGLLTQTLFRNPLATPSMLGIGNGANLGLLLGLVFVPGLGESTAVLVSFAGALASAGIISLMGISGNSRMERDRLIVGGSMLAALEASLAVGILFFHGMATTMLGWTLGRLTQVDWAQVWLSAPPIALALAAAFFLAPQLEAFLLGDEAAATLGVRTGLIQAGAMLTAVVLSGAAVAAAGPIPYVGLIVPHIFTRQRARDPRARLLLCAMGGALLTGLAELLSRLTSQRQSIPLGIWTMATGAAFFLALSLSRKGRAA